jgi:RNA polymerase sigma factor (sigma-70 family)
MSEIKIHADQKYIDGLAKNNSFVIQAIYDQYVPKVVNFIKKNSGDQQRAQDIVQEVLVTIYHQATEKGLQLTCPFDAYFFLLCKRKWFNELKKSALKEVTINEEIVSKNESVTDAVSETNSYDERQQLFNLMFKQLGNACQELLKKTFEIKSMEKVAKALGISYAYARKKKSLCMGQLTKLVQESPAYQRLKA